MGPATSDGDVRRWYNQMGGAGEQLLEVILRPELKSPGSSESISGSMAEAPLGGMSGRFREGGLSEPLEPGRPHVEGHRRSSPAGLQRATACPSALG